MNNSNENRKTPLSFFIACPREIEQILSDELHALKGNLNLSKISSKRGGVSFESSLEDAIQVGLHVRTGGRLFWKLGNFFFNDEQSLYFKSLKMNWGKVLTSKNSIKVDTTLSHDTKESFKNSHFLSLKIKDAVCDNIRKFEDDRPRVEKNHPDLFIHCHISKGDRKGSYEAEMSVDLFGHPLSMRGYRNPGHVAPLQENLAAALALTAKVEEHPTVIDCMCGTGTFLIESFWIKNNISPQVINLARVLDSRKKWCFLQLPVFAKNKKKLIAMKKDLKTFLMQERKKIKEANKNEILGSDIDVSSIQNARKTIQKAGLSDHIQISLADARAMKNRYESGVIFCNPPYGERIGEVKQLEKLYYELGEHLKNNFKNFDAWIFTGSSELRKKISLKPEEKIPFYNGPIECRMVHYGLR